MDLSTLRAVAVVPAAAMAVVVAPLEGLWCLAVAIRSRCGDRWVGRPPCWQRRSGTCCPLPPALTAAGSSGWATYPTASPWEDGAWQFRVTTGAGPTGTRNKTADHGTDIADLDRRIRGLTFVAVCTNLAIVRRTAVPFKGTEIDAVGGHTRRRRSYGRSRT